MILHLPAANSSDPILAMAIINALGPLVKTRHTLSSKIINAFLAVDIVNIPQNSPDPSKAQLQLRSVSKTIRIQLSHFLRYFIFVILHCWMQNKCCWASVESDRPVFAYIASQWKYIRYRWDFTKATCNRGFITVVKATESWAGSGAVGSRSRDLGSVPSWPYESIGIIWSTINSSSHRCGNYFEDHGDTPRANDRR